MASGRLLTDDLILADLPVQNSHSMDSSRVLLGLMALARQAAEKSPEDEALEGAISASALRSLLAALHFRDISTIRHCRRVALLSVGMAQHLGWEGRHLKLLEVAALLHDVGKIGVPDNILFKPGALNSDETELMTLHHNIGMDVLQACGVDAQVLDIVTHSRNHYGSTSEGSRKIGSEVPLGSRILAVADAYDSLSSEQVYRKAKSHAEIMQILTENSGTQFDGNIVSALARWTLENGPLNSAPAFGDAHHRAALGPADPEEALEANSLCHIFSYLYLLESLYDGFYLVDSDLRFVIWSRGAEKLLGYGSQQMLNRVWTSRVLAYADAAGQPRADHECPMHQVVATGRATTHVVKVRHADGNWKDIELQTVPLVDNNQRLQGVAEIFRDVSRTSKKPQEYHALRMAATRDALTSVANRGELENQLSQLVSDFTEQRSTEPFSIIFLDVDHFKSINDTYGHTVGDTVLIEVARLLQHETYSGELVGRYGGEEFVVLCPATDLDQAVKRAERLRIALSRTKIAEMPDRQVTASFGITQMEAGDTAESLLRRADKALYQSKEEGRNQCRSLTNAQLLGPSKSESTAGEGDNPFLHQVRFYAFVTSDMLVYKLGGFISDKRAKLLEAAPKRATFRVGATGLLPFWGSSDDRRPIEVELSFGEAESLGAQPQTRNRRTEVTLRIRPLGWIKDPHIFRDRAHGVTKELIAYFAGELG